MVVQQVRGILNPECHGGSHEAEGDSSVADHPERIRVRLLERGTSGGDDRRRGPGHRVECKRHADGVLNDCRDEGLEVGGVEASADGGPGEIVAQVLVGDRSQDRAEDGVADGAACRAEGSEETGADAKLLDWDEQARGDVGEGGYPTVRLLDISKHAPVVGLGITGKKRGTILT